MYHSLILKLYTSFANFQNSNTILGRTTVTSCDFYLNCCQSKKCEIWCVHLFYMHYFLMFEFVMITSKLASSCFIVVSTPSCNNKYGFWKRAPPPLPDPFSISAKGGWQNRGLGIRKRTAESTALLCYSETNCSRKGRV